MENATAAAPVIEVPAAPFSRRTEVAVGARSTNLVEALATAAADPRVDVGKVERLYAMLKEQRALDAEQAFNEAMAKAQAEIQPVAANATNTHTSSRYAKLEAIDRAITPIHTKYGLAISYDTETKNDADPVPKDWIRVVAFLTHSGGHSKRYHLDLPPDSAGAKGNTNKTMLQAIGSSTAYARRYLKCMIFNVSTYDDKDGNGGSGGRSGGELSESAYADHMAAIEEAADEEALKKAFGAAYNAANAAGDKDAIDSFKDARDTRRAALPRGRR